MFHKKGFAKLRPEKTQAEKDAEKTLEDFEKGVYGPKVAPEAPAQPKAPAKPDELDDEIERQMKVRRGFRKLAPAEK